MTASTFRSKQWTANKADPANSIGKTMRHVQTDYTVTSAGANAGDLYVLGGPFTVADKINKLIGSIVGFTSATSNDLGFYTKNTAGAFVAVNTGADTALWSAVDLHSAITYQDLLRNLNSSIDVTKNIGDFLSLNPDAAPYGGIYVVLRMNNASTLTTGALSLDLMVEQANTH